MYRDMACIRLNTLQQQGRNKYFLVYNIAYKVYQKSSSSSVHVQERSINVFFPMQRAGRNEKLLGRCNAVWPFR